MKIILDEEDYNLLKQKAEIIDNKTEGYINVHYSHMHQCVETKVYSGDKAIDFLNSIIEEKNETIIKLYNEINKVKEASLFDLIFNRNKIINNY